MEHLNSLKHSTTLKSPTEEDRAESLHVMMHRRCSWERSTRCTIETSQCRALLRCAPNSAAWILSADPKDCSRCSACPVGEGASAGVRRRRRTTSTSSGSSSWLAAGRGRVDHTYWSRLNTSSALKPRPSSCAQRLLTLSHSSYKYNSSVINSMYCK